MKALKDQIKKIIIRSAALMTVLALLPSALSVISVNAEGEESETESGQETTGAKVVSGIEIYRDGEKQPIEVSAGGQWKSSGVEGDSIPTQRALSVEEFADTTGSVEITRDIYTLTVATGISPGKTVEYFAVRYTDQNNNPQTKYIFPKVYSLPATYKFIESLDVENERMTKSHKVLSDMGYRINEPSVPEALSSWSVDEYLFETEAPIKKVNSIEVFMSKGSWTVQGLSVSKVTSVGGFGEYGYISGKYFLSLGKQYLCRLKSKKGTVQNFSPPGDRLFTIGSEKSIYYVLEEVSSSDSISDPLHDLYTFRMDFADLPDAGLESLIRTSATKKLLSEGTIAEDLAIEVEYKDKNGWTRSVAMPVLLSVITQTMTSEQDAGVVTMGLAQQGETLAFTACLPEYSSLISYKLYTGGKARSLIKSVGGIERKTETGSGAALELKLDKDYIQITGVSIYEGTCRISNTADGIDMDTGETLKSCTYVFDFLNRYPLLYYATPTYTGLSVSPGSNISLNLGKYNSNDILVAENDSGNLLMRLRTDTVGGSGTDGNIRLRLKYLDQSGESKISKYFNVKQEVLNYLGYWPDEKNIQSNFSYLHGMSEGNYVEFCISLPDAASVTSVEFSLDNHSNDEWQTVGVYIGVIEKMEKRRIYQKVSTAGSEKSDYFITRTTDSLYLPPFPVEMQLLLTPGRNYRIDVGSGNVISSFDTINFESVRYSLPYEKTTLDFGHTKSFKTYDINIKVADDPSSNSINGDSGSMNHFFFQLRFKNGNSGFVLANQQLSADGFRAGYNEMFSISINRDYNDLTAVRIIPEDNTDGSDQFDKLNIEQITVTERAYGGTSMEYVIDNVGWIGIDYHDEAEGSAIVGRSGRSVTDIASTYAVSYKRDVVNLYCEIEALPWIVDDPDFDQTTSSRFKASLSAEVEYLDYDGQPQTKSFDVISRMYDYMNKTPVSYEAKADGSNQSLYDNMGSVSDPDWMLRPSHKDRFSFPPLPNAKTITSITFRGTNRSTGQAQWVIGGVTLYTIITDSGVISLTSDREYYRKMELEPLCMMELEDSTANNVQLVLPSGMAESVTIPMSYNEMSKLENGGWTPAVTKFPESNNDSLNVYVYPAAVSRDIVSYEYDRNDPSIITGVNAVTVSAAMQYNLPFSKVMQVKQSPLSTYGTGTENAVFYYRGISAKDMQNLKKLTLSCRSSSMLFDHAIVQQVRDDVIVNTYSMTLGKASATMGLSAAPSKSVTVYDKKMQKMLISFSKDSKESTLFGMSENSGNVRDVAISFRYRSSLDKGMGTANAQYYTPYVYLTEAGINRITPGMMAEIPFEIPYVDEITGYRIVSFGDIDAAIESAMIVNYSYEKKDKDYSKGTYTYSGEKREECYSFNESHKLNNELWNCNSVKKGMDGKDSLNPIDLIFTTDTSKMSGSLRADVGVSMTFNYKSGTAAKTLVVPDARVYLQNESKQFVTYSEPDENGERKVINNTARMRLFIPECTELTSIDIRLTDSSGSAAWYVSTIEGSSNYGDLPLASDVETEFTALRKSVSFVNIALKTYITTKDYFMKLVTDHEIGITAEGGEEISSVVRIGRGEQFNIEAEWLVNDKRAAVSSEYYTKTTDGFSFTVPKNTSTVPQTYVLTVYSVTNPSKKDIINISVPVPESPEPSLVPPDESNPEESFNDESKGEYSDSEDSIDDESADEDSDSDSPDSNSSTLMSLIMKNLREKNLLMNDLPPDSEEP